MYIAILGRQPELSVAELESCYGSDNIRWFSKVSAGAQTGTATIKTNTVAIERLGGTIKAGQVSIDLPNGSWQRVSQAVIDHYSKTWSTFNGKITLGISAYNFDKVTARDVQRIGIMIKQKLKKDSISLRLVPNKEAQLGSATSHHNKLGLSSNKVELLVVRGDSGRIFIAESTGAQNITALAARDQARPKRDAFVGMLPPKLAQIMINLAIGPTASTSQRILDPFCGTGVILQEAALLGNAVYGTDLSEKMIRYTRDNLNWLQDTYHIRFDWYLHEGNATDTQWDRPIDAVASETYLGQPFSAPPSPAKLEEVCGNVNHITTAFLKNIHPQLSPGTPLCLAVPAWRDSAGNSTHLPFIASLAKLGYARREFTHISNNNLLYYRENQVVARELLVLTRT